LSQLICFIGSNFVNSGVNLSVNYRVVDINDNIDFSRLYPNDFFYSAVWLLKLQPMKTKILVIS